MAKGIYLDNGMTTRPSEKAIARMLPFFNEMWGSPSSPHQMGQALFPAIEESLRFIYSLLGANDKDGFVFTSSGAEAVNQAIFSTYFDITRSTGKNQFITSHIEEAPSLMSINRLQQMGCIGKLIEPNKQGIITAEIISEALNPRTALVSLSWANGLTGIINPVKEIAALCKERGVRFHIDATHVLGKIYFDLNDLGADFITFNGDNIHAPKGTGGLYIKEGIVCSPLIIGGLEQAGKRAGTLNVPALVALGVAAQEAQENRDYVCTEIARLRDKLEKGISVKLPEAIVLFKDQERLPNCTSITFKGVSNEALLFALNRRNLFASIGGGSFQQIGLILTSSGISDILSHTAVSFSLSRYTTEEEIDLAIEIISDTVSRLRKTSQQLL